jgi:hypothetical protein
VVHVGLSHHFVLVLKYMTIISPACVACVVSACHLVGFGLVYRGLVYCIPWVSVLYTVYVNCHACSAWIVWSESECVSGSRVWATVQGRHASLYIDSNEGNASWWLHFGQQYGLD